MNDTVKQDETQRIASYNRGWNDAQCGRVPRYDQPIMYAIGYTEAKRGTQHRFRESVTSKVLS